MVGGQERPVPVDPATRAELLASAWRSRPVDPATTQLLRRARFAGVELDLDTLVKQAAVSARTVDDISISPAVTRETFRRLLDLAPEGLVVPSGRTVRLTYNEDGSVTAAVKLLPLGQSAGQRLLESLRRRIPGLLDIAARATDADIGAATPGAMLASCWHETQYTRLFRS